MKIDIYTSAKNGSKYLSVPVGTKIDSLTLPSDIDADLLSLSPFKTRLEIDMGKPHPALNADEIARKIEQQGYAAHGAKTTVELKTP